MTVQLIEIFICTQRSIFQIEKLDDAIQIWKMSKLIDIINKIKNSVYYMCSILTKGSTCRKNKKLRFLLIIIEQVMTNLLKKNLAF